MSLVDPESTEPVLENSASNTKMKDLDQIGEILK
jgi:hypothetical protein